MNDVNRLVNTVDPGYSGSVWIGLHAETEYRWVWSMGDSVISWDSMWHPGEPNGDGECVRSFNGSWYDESCSAILPFVCFNDSTYYCRQHHTDLASISSPEQQNLLSDKSSLWIGLFLDSWEWSDQKSLSFRHWEADQPSQSSGSGDCVAMSRKKSGKWAQYSCDLQQPFICYGDNKFPQISGLSRPYFYINKAMSWPEAQSYCRERFTDLATADSMDDVNRLVNIVDAGYNGSVWIGLKGGTQKRWVWSDGENNTSQYYNWDSGQPDGDGDCIATNSGAWHDVPCYINLYFVCYGNSGYILVKSLKTWRDAQSYCRQHYTDLPTIRNISEKNQINQILLSGYYIWIGLFFDSWEWSDKWSRVFRHWAADQPFHASGSGDCVAMARNNSGRWAQYSCDLKKPFICYGDDKRKQIVRLKVTCKGKCALNDPSLQTAILNEISEKLKNMILESDSKISWRKGEDGELFHLEKNHTVNLDNK
ncbi:macrophage mannose receptor 1-like [Carassius carassius]|uniref:macrophage mannose receptor 1-like n=1 Tax=Carassius carassius TaxID=217509 RepID=UPI002869097F|nr:macrophage mannose receptor 1-like [Carassius carassius]